MSNAKIFINAYNKVDEHLRASYNFKSSQSFSDIVRRSAEKNVIVRKYENELIDYARLRNAIVHKSIDEKIIAEPNNEVTEKMLTILKLLTTPPKICDVFKDKNITGIDVDSTIKDLIVLTSKTGYSNIPVYKKGILVGVINHKRIVRAIGKKILNGQNVDEYINTAACLEIVSYDDFGIYYTFLSKKSSIAMVVEVFEQNKKLRAAIVTENGVMGEKVLNLLTAADLPAVNKILENY